MINFFKEKIPKKVRLPILLGLLLVIAASITVPVSIKQVNKKRDTVSSAGTESAVLDSARKEAYASAIQANESKASGFANVVVFVQFSEGNYVENETELIEKSWNDTSFPKSLASYVNRISYGKFKVNNIFPGYDATNNVYTAITVPYTDSEYLLVKSVIDQISIQSDVVLDYDGDQCIDNLTLVVDHAAVSDSSDMYYDHKTYYDGMDQINGKYVSVYNLLNSSSCMGDSLNRYGVVCHEFLHSIGYPDLYNYNDSNNNDPVGQWDLMASSSYFTTVPLTYLRSAVTNWTNMGEITGTTEGVVIDQALSPTGTQGYILRSPKSNTEFFVIEFRKQGTQFSDELDVKIPGTGLVIYRINTNVDRLSNASGENGIYVFREGVSSDQECGRVIDHNSFFSQESGRTSFGSDKKDASYRDNALCFSDGTNSGIIIKNIGNTSGETIYCDIEYIDFDQVETSGPAIDETEGSTEEDSSSESDGDHSSTEDGSQESSEGGSSTGDTGSGSDVTEGSTDHPDSGSGSTAGSIPSTSNDYWSSYTGSTGVTTSLSGAQYVYQTVTWNGSTYALYTGYDYALKVSAVNGNAVGNGVTITDGDYTNNPYMAVDSDGIYILYGIEVPKIARFNGSSVNVIDTGIPSDFYAMGSIACANGNIYFAARECHTSFTGYGIAAYCINKNGGSSPISISASGDVTAMTSDGTHVYLGVAGQNFDGTGMNVYALSGGAFYQLGDQLISGKVNAIDLEVSGGTVYAAVSSYSTNTTFVAAYNGSWNRLGQNVSNSSADKVYLNVISGKPVISYQLNGSLFCKSLG